MTMIWRAEADADIGDKRAALRRARPRRAREDADAIFRRESISAAADGHVYLARRWAI